MPLLLTPGEPAGVGPDICLQLLSNEHSDVIVVVADAGLMQKRARELELDIDIIACDSYREAAEQLRPGRITVLQQAMYAPAVAGHLDVANSRYVLDCLDTAEALCRDGQADAIVTGPVHKGIINEAGIAFSGHTEYLAAPSTSKPVMMLATAHMRVVLATTHLPLRDVAAAIDAGLLTDKIGITHRFLHERFGIDDPHILVLGLNPHAGEGGHLGMEEIEIIEPVLESLRQQGMQLSGPLPADTAFTPHHLAHADAVLAMYHDQGLPVLKYSGFGDAVNITMGLPFIRTSVDHGTALDLAATGHARDTSLSYAIATAFQLIDR